MIANQLKQIVLRGEDQTVGASKTDTVISNTQPVSYLDALNGLVDIHVSAATVTTGITATLQDSMDGTTWNDVKDSAAITGTGTVTIRWNVQDSTDQDYTPLRPLLRVVVSTGTSDSITVDSIQFATRG